MKRTLSVLIIVISLMLLLHGLAYSSSQNLQLPDKRISYSPSSGEILNLKLLGAKSANLSINGVDITISSLHSINLDYNSSEYLIQTFGSGYLLEVTVKISFLIKSIYETVGATGVFLGLILLTFDIKLWRKIK
jgi:hypothetical protein